MSFTPQRSAHFRHLNFQKWSGTISFYTFDLEMCFAPQLSALFQHLNFQEWSGTVSFLHFWLGNVLRATLACTFSTSQLPKVVRGRQLNFCVFDLEMCLAPPRRALFQHLNFQEWSGTVSFLRIWLVPGPSVFYTFDLEMCFEPQRRAIFHLSSGQVALHPPL